MKKWLQPQSTSNDRVTRNGRSWLQPIRQRVSAGETRISGANVRYWPLADMAGRGSKSKEDSHRVNSAMDDCHRTRNTKSLVQRSFGPDIKLAGGHSKKTV